MAKGTTGMKRDTTRALECVIGARNTVNPNERDALLAEAEQILRDVDSRTGRKDPSKRPPRRKPAKPAKTAKRATTAKGRRR